MTVQAKSAFGNTSGDQRPAGSPAGSDESLRMSFRFANARTNSSSPRPAQRPLLIDGHDVAVDRAGSGGARRGGRVGERRPSRDDVVDERDAEAAKRRGLRDKGAAHVRCARGPVELDLRRPLAKPAERAADRQPDAKSDHPAEKRGLVVAARGRARAVEGYRNDNVDDGAGREVPSDFERDERAKLLGEAGFGTVLEPVDRVAERSRMSTGAVNAERPDARDRLAQIAAGDAEPRAGLAAAGAARRQNDIAERIDHRLTGSCMSSSPACVRVRSAVPAGSSMTLCAPRANTAGTQGRRRPATRTTRQSRSMKMASIAKRMKNIVIDEVEGMSSPSPSWRRARGMSPRPCVS